MTSEKAKAMNVEIALKNGDKLAFPTPHNNGLTKREYMATQLMAGLLAQGIGSDVAADCSAKAADYLLIALHINS